MAYTLKTGYTPSAQDKYEYLRKNPDVAKDSYYSKNPYKHFEKFGMDEGRKWGMGTAVKAAAPKSSSTPKSTDSSSGSSYRSPKKTTSKSTVPDAPELNLPELTLSDKTSVVSQLSDLKSKDSLLRQQALVDAHERGTASGGIHSSQQGGASERAVLDSMTPLASEEANRNLGLETSNWKQKTNQLTLDYQNKYKERLDSLGYENSRKIAMAQANTALTVAMMGNITSLMNNPNIEFGQEVANKLIDILNAGQDNNNLTLDMGFTY